MIALEPCAADDARLAPLLQEYLREWSALVPVPVAVDGSFVYEQLAEVDCALIFDAAALVGFVFTTRDEDARMHVEELYIAPHARLRGLGVAAVRALLAGAPDATWTWTVRRENPNGFAFWRRACPDAVLTTETGGDGNPRTRFTITPTPTIT